MTEFPGEIEGDMRKLVLDRCPLLRIFLDPYAQKKPRFMGGYVGK